ncbi:drug/metabolite transporter (DMT)-like permease [Clostridium acetobutylicum]|uniref:Predicted permease, YCXC B.subtilis ortholog n=1 Tax=Clostridium acetobutylicum (strain ATCC 824 / DSM 792 / JCM 1419 / IAM 19013 / LMG 5710 / NBRC 13948 / NRRL B-527 / VKM B-1787 / 2291 / W) TaxID=272562 RepID=Q97IV2_CLOAB|nr:MULTISPECIES: DMT family transporter [Clostridium]AAK79505.1 Predicted permease, YCXC B.subtilis ortholog [Clostridium acetobutylicum ATCC 824]ADZ20590.1 permease [Clostridium acetobutylicum EA 2018]AEI33323.1 permease [Clostridium acetobutylicum DSM 1731]AWV81250.1 DMT family transporter [Clostridium acetobutylicum]MBC2392884.1 DMT family transporter [Clostridium acetobutylicum]
MNGKQKILPYIAATVSSTIFGLSFLFSKMALKVAGPLSLVALRFLLAFIIMTILVLFRVIKVDYRNKPIGQLVLLGLAEPVIYFIFETYGVKNISSSMAGLMLALIPIVVTIMGSYFLKEVPSLKRTSFIVLSVSGVALIGVMGSSGGSGNSPIGILFLLGAVTCAGAYSIISRKTSVHFKPVEITYFMMFFAAFCFNIMAAIQLLAEGKINEYFSPLKSSTFVISILYLGILSSIVAYFLTNFTLSKIQASRSSVFSNLSTIVSIIAGVIILKESFHLYHLVGSVLILTGVWGTNKFK